MKACRSCGTNNIDDANLCVGCGAPLTELAAEAEVQRALEREQSRQKWRRMRGVAVGLMIIGAVAAMLWRGNTRKAERKQVADFYLALRQVYDGQVVEFWKCVTRGAQLPETNLQLSTSIEEAFRKAPKGYLIHLRDRCLPMAEKAPGELRAVRAPEPVAEPLHAYANALAGVAQASLGFAKELQTMAETAELDAKVLALGGTYHYADADSADTYAYDQFLRCAIPGYDAMQDMQPVLEFLFSVLKDPAGHVARWRQECEPALADTGKATPHARYKEKLEKFSADPREVQAFTDCFRKADDKARQKRLEPLEQAWFAQAQSWEALKGSIKNVLGEVH